MAKSDISVFLRLVGQRKFAAEVAASGAELEAMGLKGAKALSAFATQGEKLKKFGRTWTRHISLPVAGVGAAAVGFAVDFDRAMRNVNSIAQLPEPQLHKLERSVLGLAGPTAQSPKTLAEGLYDLVSSGFDAQEGLVVLRKSALAASAGLTTTEVATGAVAAVINAYGLKAHDAGRISDQLFETVNRGVLTFEDLASTVGDVLPFASQLGVGLNQVGAAVSTMTKAGLSAPETMTRIKNVLVTMLKPGKDLSKTLKNMGTTGEQLVRRKGLQGALEAIVGQTNGSKTAIAKLFPNIRAMGGVLALTGKNAGRATEDLQAFADTAGATNKALSQQEKSVGFKAQRAWAKLQATLIRLGDKVLPVLVPAAEKLASVIGTTLDTFIALPGPVQASIAGFLILTGPVLSGLGYFASGLGRILVLTNGVAKFGRTFSAAMQEAGYVSKLTVASSFGEAWGGSGAAGALQTAKDFAYSLGPALAAYGIGNIVTSALNGDWKDAGFEAGGAIAGGIAGFMLGGPLGAMIGVGIGSFGGELLSGLFGGDKKVGAIQEKLARDSHNVAKYFKEQHEAGANLARSTSHIKDVQGGLAKSSHRLRLAESALATAKHRSGRSSVAAARAEWRVTHAMRGHEHAIHALRKAERLHGQMLQWFKQISRTTVLEERNQINNLTRKREHIIDLFRSEQAAGAGQQRLTELAKRGQNTVKELAGAQKHYKETLQEASQKAGPKFARFLEQGTQWALDFGGALKAMNARLRATKELTGGLSETNPFAIPDLGGLGSGREQPSPIGPPAPKVGPPAPHRTHRTAAHPPTNRNRSRPLFSAPQRRLSLDGDRVIELHNHMHVTVVSEIDGKSVAENTTKHSQRAANRA